jgi:hypothetical protein
MEEPEQKPWLIEFPLVLNGEDLQATAMFVSSADDGTYMFILDKDAHMKTGMMVGESSLDVTAMIGVIATIAQSFQQAPELQVFSDPVDREKFMEGFLPILEEHFANRTV